MTDASLSEIDPLNSLAEEFLTRYRQGERPAVAEYTTRHPDLAERIRELFPTLLLMENLGPPTRESVATSDATPPRHLGEYRLVREVGRGGMGVVYEAVQESLGRRVAVKVLPSTLHDDKHRERFQREAKAAARLHHTNIVPVFGVGEHDGQPFYVMQFIDGRGLDAVLRDMKGLCGSQPLAETVTFAGAPQKPAIAHGLLTAAFHANPDAPGDPPSAGAAAEARAPAGQPDAAYFREAARLSVQAAEALAHAHGQGVLHRDIKPANLLLDTQGTLWIADFGLAKADDDADLTAQGDMVGTLRYLAPERFREPGDARADVYALGVTFYELLTLRPAFEETDRARLIERILGATAPARPRQLMPAVPVDLETIALKAMAHDAADRYATAEALAEDLRRFLADRPILARRSSLVERLRRWRRRNPVVAWLTSAVVVLTLSLALGSTLAAAWLLRALSESETARKDQREHLWRSLIDQARANRRGGRIGQRVESLRILDEAARIRVTPEIRNEVIACLTLIDSEEVAHWPRPKDPGAVDLAFDFARRRYARYDRTGAVSVRQMADDAEVFHLDSVGELFPWGLHFSPDGRYFAQYIKPDGRHLVWDVTNRTPKLLFRDVLGPPKAYHISEGGDGRLMAVRHADGSVLNYDLAAGRRLFRLPPGSAAGTLALHPRRPWLALANGASLRVVNIENGREVVRLVAPATIDNAAWHPDGTRLTASALDHKIYLWDVTVPRLLLTFEGHKNFGVYPAFHPSGQVMTSHDWDGWERWWDVASGRQLLSTPAAHGGWLPNEPFLQAEDSPTQQRLHRLVEQRVLRTLAYQSGSRRQRFHEARIDPAGRWLVGFTLAESALFDLAKSAVLADSLPGPRWSAPGVDPTGALLVGSRKDLIRRPLVSDGEGKVRFGPAETLYRAPGEGWSCTADGRIAAVGCYNQGALLFHRDQPEAPLRLGPQGDVRITAVSPDGRWVATSTWEQLNLPAGVKVWDAVSGRLVKDLPLKESHQLGFSPDGRWLGLVDGQRCRLWRSGSWEEGPAIDGTHFAFGADGVLAVANKESIRLMDVDSGEEFACLEAPRESAPSPQCFSADGTLLVAIGLESDTLMIWDLRALREELAARGLDWDRPPYPPAKSRTAAVAN